jgi:glycosyltransferase involved in cell wall biosynthesis
MAEGGTAPGCATPLRVLVVIDSLGQGGSERSLVDTLRAMPDRHVDIALFRRTAEGYEDEALDAGMVVHEVPGGVVRRVVRLRRLVRRLGPDVVHSSLWNADLAARLALLGRPQPLVCSLVNDTYDASRRSGAPLRRRVALRVIVWIDRVTAHRVDRFHAVTHSVAAHHAAHVPATIGRTTVAWRGRDARRYQEASSLAQRAAAREELGLQGFVLLAVGRLEPQKSHQTLLAAMPAVLAKVPDARCVVVGRDGAAAPALREQIHTSGLEGRACLAGFRSDVPRFLAAADCMVLPSLYEGIAGAVIEAMLAGTPVIASDLPGVREITEDGRLVRLVPASDPAALARAIVELARDPAAARARAEEAQAHAERHLALPAAADALRRIYVAAIRQRAPG